MLRNTENRNILFISRDDTELAKLAEQLNVNIVRVDCSREDFGNYIRYLEELFGGLATLKFRRYNVKKLPCLVVKGRKVFEGPIPLSKIYELLGVETPTIAEKYVSKREAHSTTAVSKCYRCIFFNEKRSRCVIYGLIDPSNPPCK